MIPKKREERKRHVEEVELKWRSVNEGIEETRDEKNTTNCYDLSIAWSRIKILKKKKKNTCLVSPKSLELCTSDLHVVRHVYTCSLLLQPKGLRTIFFKCPVH